MSSMEGFISASDFVDYLEKNNLVIVSRTASVLEDKEVLRSRLLRRKSVTLKEVVDAGFFHYKTKQGLLHAIERGDFGKDEWYKEVGGNERIRILTAAIKKRIDV